MRHTNLVHLGMLLCIRIFDTTRDTEAGMFAPHPASIYRASERRGVEGRC
jgi:hypothetical protein